MPGWQKNRPFQLLDEPKLYIIKQVSANNVNVFLISYIQQVSIHAWPRWYGSKEAFENLVRGPLCEELLGVLSSPHLPFSYAALISTSTASAALDSAIAAARVAPDSSAATIGILCWSSYLLCGSLGTDPPYNSLVQRGYPLLLPRQ